MKIIIITKLERNSPVWIIDNEDFLKEGVSKEELNINIIEQIFKE